MPFNVNPMQIIQMIRGGQNPQQVMMNILDQGAQNANPLYANLINLARNNKTQEIENIARNMCKERGIDFDTAFNDFRRNLGI